MRRVSSVLISREFIHVLMRKSVCLRLPDINELVRFIVIIINSVEVILARSCLLCEACMEFSNMSGVYINEENVCLQLPDVHELVKFIISTFCIYCFCLQSIHLLSSLGCARRMA